MDITILLKGLSQNVLTRVLFSSFLLGSSSCVLSLAHMASHEHSESACSKCPLVLPLTPAQKRRTKMSITELLDIRSRGVFDAATLATQNLKLMRSLVLQDNKNFIKVWSKTSKSPVRYELGKLYFENFQSCYSCIDSQPQVLYKLSKPSSKSEKIEDALLCQSPLEKTLPSPSDHKPCLLTLTANSWLCRLSTETGEVIQKVYLSPDYKFRYLAWDLPQERFYVKSVLNKPTPLARQAGISQNTLLHFAIFHIFPLQIVGIMEINKTVFGNGVTEVNLSEGILAVSHNKSVKLYSFENLINKYMTNALTLGEQSPCNGGGIVGNSPYGIPVNIQIKESLPVLFELQYGGDGMVEFGGFPWHYIYTPPQKKYKGTHHICSLADDTLAINGIQEMEGYSIESDAIYFHTDLSGRVLHFGPSNINMLKIRHELSSGLPCEVAEDFSITACRNNNATSTVTVTSSGRTVKRRFHQLDDDPAQETFRMLEYEDELDLLAVVAVTDEGGEGRASIRLHDNKSGELLRTIPLEEPWDETYQHELYFDRETLVHIEQKNNHFCCHVYKLHPNGTLMLYKASSQPLFQFPRPLPVDSGVI